MTPIRAVLFDALGTLVELQPPAPRLRAALLEATDLDIGAEAAERGFAAEIAYYLDHHMEGGDPAGLERLRDDCARVMQEAVAVPGLDLRAVRLAMVASLEFTAFGDAEPALRALRDRGLRLVAVSNWDCSLALWLRSAGIGGLLDGAVSSAEVGQPKPSPAIFRAALEIAGVEAVEALHVGDSIHNDVEGARAAGIRAVLVDRGGPGPAGVLCVRSLEEVASLT
ncbi:MAG: HAD family hydrolase [Thermoleophilaceae bacterium]|jgi:putative hydrolase of the HAD superfamily|nr:HAD family hydrolase [Thermoleophilaceae bacterium]